MYYSGIDLHLDNCYITTVDETGTVVKQQRIENCNESILDYFQSLPGSHQAVVESSTGWYWLNESEISLPISSKLTGLRGTSWDRDIEK